MENSLLTIAEFDEETFTFHARTIKADACSGEIVIPGKATDAEIIDYANHNPAAPECGSFDGAKVEWEIEPSTYRCSPQLVTTQADYWLAEHGRWRTCRKPFKCNGLGGSLPEQQCEHDIRAGEQYLDTGATRTWPGTHRMCKSCAMKLSKALALRTDSRARQ